jgi:hypothetical protein
VFVLALALVVQATPSHAVDKDVKAAAKAAYKTFLETSFVAKMDLRNYGHHYVLPDGSPAQQKSKKQGRGGEGALFAKKIKVQSGETGEGIYVRAKKDEITVQLTKKRKGMNGTWVHILFDRRVVPDDFEPAKLARAVSSLAVIKGYEPGADIAAAFDEAGAGEELPSAFSDTQVAPSISSFNVRVEPPRIARGTEARVVLEYDVSAPTGRSVEVLESRSLLLGGKVLPSFPTSERLVRNNGHFQTIYSQPIPSSAATGVYELEAEVCVAGGCTSRRVILEVTP